QHGKERVLVVLNNGEKPATVRLQVPTTARAFRLALRSDESDEPQRIDMQRNGWISFRVPAMTGWVLLASSGNRMAGDRNGILEEDKCLHVVIACTEKRSQQFAEDRSR
ncbi:MAG: hypothetical protein ACP5RN_14520, partial [Armatimonadota bacterium]